jgi:MFS transporter, SP family, sugar:H+ symporter
MELAVVPIFQAEIVPAEVRGFVVGTYQLMLNVRFPKPRKLDLLTV